MINLRRLALAAAAALALFAAPVEAAQINMCSADVAGGVQGPHTIGGTTSPVPSGTIYILNGQGCALIAQGDVGYFQSQGFTQASSEQTILFTTGALPASGTTDIVGPVIPAGAYIKQIIWNNTTANAVTGGMSVGTTANGTDVVAAQTLAANALVFTTDALLLKRVFSLTAGTTLHFAPVTSSNTSNITISIMIGYF